MARWPFGGLVWHRPVGGDGAGSLGGLATAGQLLGFRNRAARLNRFVIKQTKHLF